MAQLLSIPAFHAATVRSDDGGSFTTDDVTSEDSIEEGSHDSDDADNLPVKSSKGEERAIPSRKVDIQQEMQSSLTASYLEVSTRHGSSVDQSAGASPHDDSSQGAVVVPAKDIFYNPWAKGDIRSHGSLPTNPTTITQTVF